MPLLRGRHLLRRGGGGLSRFFEAKDAMYKWFGVALAFWAIILLAFGIDMWTNEPAKEREMGLVSMAACFPGFLVSAIYIGYAGVVAERKRRELQQLAAYLKAYRRIRVEALADKLRLSEFETEKRILRCVRHGLLTGYVDRASNEFFNPQGMEGKALIKCPNCGGSVEQLVLAGDTCRCPYCDSVLPPP